MNKTLRDYQNKIKDTALANNKDIIVVLPTGAGKTVIAHAIIEELIARDETVLFVVPRLELITQAEEEFSDLNPDMIWRDKTRMSGSKIIIASKDSLMNKSGVPENTIMIIDEAHYGIKGSKTIVNKIKPKQVIGLTATPERMDGQALLKGTDAIHKYGIFDEVIQQETVASLIKKQYLAPLKYYARPIDGITEVKSTSANAEELSDDQMREIFDTNHIWGDIVKSYEEFALSGPIKRPALGFTNTVAMAEEVCALFNESGYDFRVIHGEMNVKERTELIEMLRTGEIDGLVNAQLLTYGFDCPPVSYAFSLRHIKSRPLWFQIVGRILRTCEGKEDAIFVDHGDSISEFAEPDCSLPIMDETIQWRVNGETKEEKDARKKKQKKVQDTMKLIADLDPLPSKLVEVTMENTWERLLRIINKLRKENAALFEKTEELNKKNEQISSFAQDAIDRVNILAKEKQQLQIEKELLAKEKGIVKVIDYDKTFEYIKKNYLSRYLRLKARGYTGEELNQLIEKLFKEDENKLDFYYHEGRYQQSMVWWHNNRDDVLKRSKNSRKTHRLSNVEV